MTKSDCRGKLMEVSTQLFAERGLHGVSIRELSQAAGASISMISYYFGGKEGLYAAVLQEQFACFAEVDQIAPPGADPEEVIEAYIRWTIRRHRNHPYLLRFYTSELTNPTPFFSTIVSPAIANVLRALAATLEEGVAKGRVARDVNPMNAVVALAGMVNYFFLSTMATADLINHNPEKDEELIREYRRIFTRGVLDGRC